MKNNFSVIKKVDFIEIKLNRLKIKSIVKEYLNNLKLIYKKKII